jgi:RNA polymerase sigma-70 factor, ECF subfamily
MATMTLSLVPSWKTTQQPAWTVVQPEPSPEAQLRDRVLAGDTEAFFELVQPYQRGVFLAALGVLGNEADAEDVAQEALLKALKYLRSFRGECKFSTWLIQIALNESRMRLRKDRRHLYESMDEGLQSDDGDYIPRDFADWREIPSESLERTELRDALQRAMTALPEKYRSVLMLRDVEQLSTEESAKLLGITIASVKTRLSRARLRMRDLLLEMGAATGV